MMKSRIIVFAWSIRDVDFYRNILSDCEVTIVCGRISAWLYAKLIERKVYSLFGPSIGFGLFPNRKNKEGSLFTSLDLSFYRNSSRLKCVNFYKIIEKVHQIFENEEFDLLMLPGEYRLREQLMYLGRPALIPTIFWEAGPPGKIYFSKYGTNANAMLDMQYALKSIPSLMQEHDVSEAPALPTISDFRKRILKLFDLIFTSFSVYVLRSFEYEEFLPEIRIFRQRKIGQENIQPDMFRGCIVFYGQVEADVNNSHFGIEEKDFLKFLDNVEASYPHHLFILKPHPREFSNTFNKLIISRLGDRVVVYTSSVSKISDMFDDVHHVTVNSNITLELLSEGRAVTLLGQSIYSSMLGIKRSFDEVNPSCDQVMHGAQSFSKNNFINLDYRADKWKSFRGMAKLLIKLTGDKSD